EVTAVYAKTTPEPWLHTVAPAPNYPAPDLIQWCRQAAHQGLPAPARSVHHYQTRPILARWPPPLRDSPYLLVVDAHPAWLLSFSRPYVLLHGATHAPTKRNSAAQETPWRPPLTA